MFRFVVLFLVMAAPVMASPLDEYRWQSRVLVVFADSPLDPAFVEQMRLLEAEPDPLLERDVVVIADTDTDSALRDELRPRGFMIALIGKDGNVALRKPFPWDVRELSRVIDKMPIRLQELAGER